MLINDPTPSAGGYQKRLPTLFLIWLALSAISPHPDLFKGWFHLAMGLPVLALMCVGRLRINTPDTLLRICVGIILYTALSSLIISQADWSQHLHALRWELESLLLVLVLFLALPPLLKNPLFLGRFMLGCVVLGCLSALIIFGVFHNFSGRLTGIGALYQPIEGMSTLIVYLSLGAFLLWQERHKLNRKDHALLFVALILTCACTLLSGSRGPSLALVATAVYCLLVGAIAHRHWKSLLIAAMGLTVALIAVIAFYGLDNFINTMLERGTSHRLLLWSAHLQHPPDSLLFGHGAATDLESTPAGLKIYRESGIGTAQPHNLFIGTFVQTGLIGLTLLLAMLSAILRSIYTAHTNTAAKFYMLGIFGLIMMLVTTNTYTLIISVKTIWLYTWLPLIFLWLWSKQPHSSNTDGLR